MKKISYLMILFLASIMFFGLCSCTLTTKKYQITLIYKQETETIEAEDNESIKKYINEKYSSDEISGWYLNDEIYSFEGVLSSNLTLVAKSKYNPTNYDGNNRVIKIISDSDLCIYDPFDNFYVFCDKEERQIHQRKIEEAYNIKIEYVYDVFSKNELEICIFDNYVTKADKYYLENNFYELDERFANKNNILTAQVGNYGYSNPIFEQEILLFYSQNVIENLGLEDPLTLWHEGKWTISYFNEYITKIVESDAYSESIYPVFSHKTHELMMGFSAACGEMLIPSLDNVNVSSETNMKIFNQIKTYIDLGYINESLLGIFNALYTSDYACIQHIGYDKNESIKAVPFPIMDDEVDLLKSGNLSSANYKVSTIPGRGVYMIPNLEDTEDLSKEVLENIIYDLVVQYDGPKPYYMSTKDNNYNIFNYNEFMEMINSIKNNHHDDYYLDIDSQRLSSAFDYRTLKIFDKNLINQHAIDHNNYCEYVIKDIYGIEPSKKKDK